MWGRVRIRNVVWIARARTAPLPKEHNRHCSPPMSPWCGAPAAPCQRQTDDTNSRTAFDSFADEAVLFLPFRLLLPLPIRANPVAHCQVRAQAALAAAFLFLQQKRRGAWSAAAAAPCALPARSGKLALALLYPRHRGHRRRRRHATHRVRAEHHRMAAHHGRPPAPLAHGMGGRV